MDPFLQRIIRPCSKKGRTWDAAFCDQRLISVKLQATVCPVKIRNFAHKGLKRLYSEESAKGVPPDTVDKLRKMFAYIENMEDPEELRMLTAWKVHS
jgi:hypothetical protein